MPELPVGTVTFLFTDIEGSTRLLHELGAGYADVLAEHRRVLREAFGRHAGVEVDTQGDAFFVAFPRATDAVAAAEAAQRGLAGGPMRVRMGVHTGEPLVTGEGYVGVDVHRAARVMSAGHGGQVLVSETTRRLLTDAFELRDLGEHRLKDLTAPQRLYQLGGEQFPPLKTLHQSNLPVQLTPLVGRRRELEELTELVRSSRLVTLTGTGGSGKTRVALQVAAELLEEFPHGVWWVPLSAVRDPKQVLPAIAATIGADELVAHLRGQRTLLLLDNFEQVVQAAPDLAELLREAPGIALLVTSREPLRLAGEQEYQVEPLPEEDAVELFVSRARLLQRDFEPDVHVREICNRLDGLPLAVELAAARVRLLEPVALLARLNQRLDLLGSGTRDAPERQRTLTATIAWSYDLLDAREQELFRRLSVFAGGWTIEAAEEVCEAKLDTLQSLVDKSLVRAGEAGRFFMLETIREFAADRLGDAIRRRHAEYFVALAESANLAADAEGPQRNEVALMDQQNMRAALAWALVKNEIELLLRLVVALENFWATNDPDEAKRWLIAAAAGESERAGRLWGAVETELERGPIRMFTIWLHRELRLERVLAHADEAFERGRAAGRELSLDEAAAAALEVGDA